MIMHEDKMTDMQDKVDDVEAKKRELARLRKTKEELEAEKERMNESSAKFTIYLKTNSTCFENDYFKDYAESEIKAAGANTEKVEQLKQVRKMRFLPSA